MASEEILPEWFSFDKISHEESDSFRDIFSKGILNESEYLEIRNIILSMQKTHGNLSVTFLRRNISCDFSILLQIYTFLEHWGLLNTKNINIESHIRPSEKKNPILLKINPRFICSICHFNSDNPKAFLCRDSNINEIICENCFANSLSPELKSHFFNVYKREYVDSDKNEFILDMIIAHGNDWKLIASNAGLELEDSFANFIEMSIDNELSHIPYNTLTNPFQSHESPSQLLLHILSVTLTPSFASCITNSVKNNFDSTIFIKNSINIMNAELDNLNILKNRVFENSLQKISLKIAYLEEIEASLVREKSNIERHRLQIFMERFNLKKSSIVN